MIITTVGYICILLGLISLCFMPNLLFYLIIIFSPFTAASIFSLNPVITGLQPVYFFIFLLIVNYVYKYFSNLKNSPVLLMRGLTKEQKIFCIAVLLFWGACLISLLMPVLFKNSVVINYSDYVKRALMLRKLNITQFIYLTIVLIISILTMINMKEDNIKKSIIAMIYVTFFTVIWGVFQFASYYLKIDYPYYLFNNNAGYMQGWNQMILGVKRICSVSTEPSTFALYLLMMISLMIIFYTNKYYIIPKYSLIIILISTCFVTILTTSTTAYVGILFLIIVMILLNFIMVIKQKKKVGIQFLNYLKFIIIFLGLIYISYYCYLKVFHIDSKTIIDTFKTVSINKISSESGITRSSGALENIKLFLKFPLFGVGWGSTRSFDLITTLMANVGIVGTSLYLFIIFISVKVAYTLAINNIGKKISIYALALMISTIIGTIILCISVPEIYYVYYWIIIGMTMALPGCKFEK